MTDTKPTEELAYTFNLREIIRKQDKQTADEDFLEWLFLTLTTAEGESARTHATIDAIQEASEGLEKVTLSIQLNGIEVDAQRLVRRLKASQDWRVKRLAAELLKDIHELDEFLSTMDSLRDLLSGLERDVESKIQMIRNDAGLPSLGED